MPDITIQLSNLNISLPAEHPYLRRLCAPFLTAAPADHVLTVTPDDLTRARDMILEQQAQDGLPSTEPTPAYIESLAVHGAIADLLPSQSRLLTHGSALAYKGEAVEFMALSGTGKSTHSRLWREAFGEDVTMIDDDKPILEITPEGVTAWGTPWNGKHRLGTTGGAPLKAIVLLKRGETTTIRPITPREAYEQFFYQIYMPQDEANLQRTLDLIDRLTAKVDLYELQTTMDPEAAVISRNGIFGEQ